MKIKGANAPFTIGKKFQKIILDRFLFIYYNKYIGRANKAL